MSEHEIERALIYIGASIAWAVTGYLTNVREDDDVDFDGLKFGKTVAVGVVAGAIMLGMGDELTHEAFMTAAAIAIPIVDRLLNRSIDQVRAG